MGSVVGEVDPAGNLTASKLLDVYGATRGYSGSPTTRQGFVGGLGHQTDNETGLVYMRARYYDPSTGRFVSEDDAEDGINWFTYCDCDPINKTDFTGHMADASAIALKEEADYDTKVFLAAGGALASVIAIIAGYNYIEKLALDGVFEARSKGLTGSEGKIGSAWGISVGQVKSGIEALKQGGGWRGNGGLRNPDVVVDLETGEVYPLNPDGSYGDGIGNLKDELGVQD